MNLFWFALLILVITFLVLGVLVMLGMKKEAWKFIEALMEGSFTVIDIASFLRKIWDEFLELVKQLVNFLAPMLGMALAFLLYVLIFVTYKWVGAKYDVTLMTIVLTALIIIFNALINQAHNHQAEAKSWLTKAGQSFHHYFRDTFEVMIFIFFLTMDATFFFFLPARLNVPLKAEIAGYDLMKRGFTIDHYLKITINLVIITISIEILRNIIRLAITSIKIFRSKIKEHKDQNEKSVSSSSLLKYSLRRSIGQNNEQLLKFVSYTTLFSLIFLLFPRLKLLAMSVTSVTNFGLDLVMPKRLSEQNKHDDIISRTLAKIFKI